METFKTPRLDTQSLLADLRDLGAELLRHAGAGALALNAAVLGRLDALEQQRKSDQLSVQDYQRGLESVWQGALSGAAAIAREEARHAWQNALRQGLGVLSALLTGLVRP